MQIMASNEYLRSLADRTVVCTYFWPKTKMNNLRILLHHGKTRGAGRFAVCAAERALANLRYVGVLSYEREGNFSVAGSSIENTCYDIEARNGKQLFFTSKKRAESFRDSLQNQGRLENLSVAVNGEYSVPLKPSVLDFRTLWMKWVDRELDEKKLLDAGWLTKRNSRVHHVFYRPYERLHGRRWIGFGDDIPNRMYFCCEETADAFRTYLSSLFANMKNPHGTVEIER